MPFRRVVFRKPVRSVPKPEKAKEPQPVQLREPVASPKPVKLPKKQKKPKPRPEPQAISTLTSHEQALVTLNDTHISSILNDQRYLSVIPCLAAGKQKLKDIPKTCGRCARKRSVARKEAMKQIRQCIAGLRGTQQADFKRIFGAKEVTVVLSTKQKVTI